MTGELDLLHANMTACALRVEKLAYSLNICRGLFRGIAYAEQEDLGDKSNRDKTLLMEKLGAIRSAEEFGSAALLRNKFAHHYPEEAATRLDRLNLVAEEAEFVIASFGDIQRYLQRKDLAPKQQQEMP